MYRPDQPLELGEWLYIIEHLLPHVKWFKLSGGEPTLYPGFGEIVRFLDEQNAPFRLLTNGLWPDPDYVLDLLTHSPTLESLLISLNGPDPDLHEAFTCNKGSFIETVRNIRQAVQADLRVATSIVITKYNWDKIDKMVDFNLALGVDHLAFNRYIGPSSPSIAADISQLVLAVERVEQLKEEGYPLRFGTPIRQCLVRNETNVCLAGKAFVTVDPSGNVRPCNHASLLLGNLLDQDINSVLESQALKSWYREIPSSCSHCDLLSVCGGGCRVDRSLNESIWEVAPIRGVVEAAVL
jgi:radical SAM protein with 4Fe4S-binding SPASM domain